MQNAANKALSVLEGKPSEQADLAGKREELAGKDAERIVSAGKRNRQDELAEKDVERTASARKRDKRDELLEKDVEQVVNVSDQAAAATDKSKPVRKRRRRGRKKSSGDALDVLTVAQADAESSGSDVNRAELQANTNVVGRFVLQLSTSGLSMKQLAKQLHAEAMGSQILVPDSTTGAVKRKRKRRRGKRVGADKTNVQPSLLDGVESESKLDLIVVSKSEDTADDRADAQTEAIDNSINAQNQATDSELEIKSKRKRKRRPRSAKAGVGLPMVLSSSSADQEKPLVNEKALLASGEKSAKAREKPFIGKEKAKAQPDVEGSRKPIWPDKGATGANLLNLRSSLTEGINPIRSIGQASIENIAQEPALKRESVKLLERDPKTFSHHAQLTDRRSHKQTGHLKSQGSSTFKQAKLTDHSSNLLKHEDLVERIRAGEVKELDVILKTDVQGSIEPIRTSLERLSDENVKVKVIHEGTGNVTESDVLLAQASKAVVIGFNVKIEPGAKRMAENAKVDIRLYEIIYD
ncbi:MAG: hypothetical protein K6T85_00085, partial [Gorillibacterium sp.]|nr:hypothetical protein [Gorillibacterium sp.]